jgi:DNA-binding NarL/FixJ family response regulator
MGDALNLVDLPPRRLRACLLRVRGRHQWQIARRLRVSQQTVSRELAAAVQRYPTLRPLLFPSRVGQRRRTEAA